MTAKKRQNDHKDTKNDLSHPNNEQKDTQLEIKIKRPETTKIKRKQNKQRNSFFFQTGDVIK